MPDLPFAEMETTEGLNARKETVGKHLKEVNTVFTYLYDFGDDWKHTITLTQIDSTTISDAAPICLDGARSCPQEDVGGVGGHEHMLEVLSTPYHPDFEQYEGWVKEGFDAAYFSCEEVNAVLHKQKKRFILKTLAQPLESKKAIKLTKPALNKYLKSMSPDELIELIKDCYNSSKDMEKFLAVRVMGEEAVEALFLDYRKKVVNEFFPERGHGKLRLKEAKKAITEFEKLTGNKKYSVELKLIYVEMGVQFTDTYGDINESFYNSMESVYGDVIEAVNLDETSDLFVEYEERISAIVSNTRDMGWGFHENLYGLYGELE